MTTDDWHQFQRADPVLNLIIVRIQVQDGSLGQGPFKPTDPLKFWQFLQDHNHLKLRWGILYQKILLKELQEAQFQLVLLDVYRGTALRGCDDEVSHLGLEQMLNLMHNHFFWP